MRSLGIAVSATTVRTWLRSAGLGPAGNRRVVTWREFVRAHRHSMLAVDFFTVERSGLNVMFFIELGSQQIIWPDARPTPSAPWVTQQVRHVT